jgi:hypothetical protein
MFRRILVVLIGIGALLALWLPGSGTPAGAVAAATTDPSGDVAAGPAGTMPFDIVRVTHADTASTITYTFQNATNFTEAQRQAHWIEWELTLDAGHTATVDAGDLEEFVCDLGTASGTVTVTRAASGLTGSTAANTMTVSFPSYLLAECGQTTTSYAYDVFVQDPSVDTGYDQVPDSGTITHTLDQAPSTTTSTSTSTTQASSTTTQATTTTTRASTTTTQASTTTTQASTTTTTAPGGSTTSTTGGSTTTTTTDGSTTTTQPSSTTTTHGMVAGTTTTAAGGATTTTTAPTTQSTATVSKSTVAPGEDVTFTGSGFKANTDLAGTFESTPVSLGTVRSDASGNVRAVFRIPASATAGAHQIVVSGPAATSGTHRAVANVTVVRSASGTLPATGARADRLALVGVAFLALGVYSVWWRRTYDDPDFGR